MKKDFLVVIPARMGSTRFPGKVLADLRGLPVVEWCRRAAVEAGIGPVLVATDDGAVAERLRPFGADVVMTSDRCPSGTDRVWQAARKRPAAKTRFIMNLQGDEPLISTETIRRTAQALRARPRCDISTAVVPAGAEEAGNPNAVKAVLARDGRCLYFSRAPIPYPRNSPEPSARRNGGPAGYFKHVGLYAFRRAALARFVRLPPSPLEKRESLEQLRALEAGMTIVAAVAQGPNIAVDTPEDLERVRGFLSRAAARPRISRQRARRSASGLAPGNAARGQPSSKAVSEGDRAAAPLQGADSHG